VARCRDWWSGRTEGNRWSAPRRSLTRYIPRVKQLIGRSDSVVVTRMPEPVAGGRDVVVRNRFSLVSTGTETAGMTAPADLAASGRRARSLYRQVGSASVDPGVLAAFGEGKRLEAGGAAVFSTGSSEYGYAARSPVIALAPDSRHIVSIRLRVISGNVSVGLLAARERTWLTTQAFPYPRPELRFTLSVDVPAGKPLEVHLIVSNHLPGGSASSAFEVLEVVHHRWERVAAPPEPEPAAATEPLTGEQRVKRAVKRMLIRFTGQENSWQEQTLKRWYGKAIGDAVLANTRVVRGRDLPSDEMSHQGWFLGYSSAGEVVAVGRDVTEVTVGDLVACAGAGRANHAEVVSVPVMLTAKLPQGVDCRMGCSATVGAIAMQGVRRAEVELGHRVVVIGLGLIGQITVQILKAAGCRVIGFDLMSDRVERALLRGMDAGAAVEGDLIALVNRLTGEHGADAVIVTAATKSDHPINLAMKLARRRGKVIVSGDVDLHPQRGDFYRKEIDFGLATSYGPGRYDASYEDEGRDYPLGYVRWTANRNLQSYLELLASGAVDFLGLIENEVDLEDAGEAYAQLVASPVKPMALVLRYGAEDSEPSEGGSLAEARSRVELAGGAPLRAATAKGPFNVVLVGAGGFAQGMLAPRMLELPEYFQLAGVVSKHGAAGSNFARSIGVGSIASDLKGFLADPAVHALVIATRHSDHAEQVLAGVRAGKHVFVEKPLVVSTAQLQSFLGEWEAIAASRADAGRDPAAVVPIVMVGFNRRFSPAMRVLREQLAGRATPLMVNYRINAGRIPLSSWIQGSEGGGRNIGEACHMYDLFRALTGAAAVDVRAMPLGKRPADVLANDNFVATIRYEDGSVCTLTYTAQGPKQGLAKERIEVFCGGEAWIIDDFTTLTKAGTESPLWEGAVDKGHAEELRRFGQAMAGERPAPIPFEEILETTMVSLAVEDALKSGS